MWEQLPDAGFGGAAAVEAVEQMGKQEVTGTTFFGGFFGGGGGGGSGSSGGSSGDSGSGSITGMKVASATVVVLPLEATYAALLTFLYAIYLLTYVGSPEITGRRNWKWFQQTQRWVFDDVNDYFRGRFIADNGGEDAGKTLLLPCAARHSSGSGSGSGSNASGASGNVSSGVASDATSVGSAASAAAAAALLEKDKDKDKVKAEAKSLEVADAETELFASGAAVAVRIGELRKDGSYLFGFHPHGM